VKKKTVDLKEFMGDDALRRQSARRRVDGAAARERFLEEFPTETCSCGDKRRRHERLCDACLRAATEALGVVPCPDAPRRVPLLDWRLVVASAILTVCAGLLYWALLSASSRTTVTW
jgi:hypothetical protein